MYSSVDPFKSYQLQCRVRSYNGIYPLKPWLHSEVRSCAHQSTSYSVELDRTIEFTHRNHGCILRLDHVLISLPVTV